MEAEACACYSDGPAPDFMTVRTVKARKPHKCCECGDIIMRGQSYEKITGLWDGEIETFKTCLPCSSIRRDYAPCSYFMELDEAIANALGVHLDGTLA